PKKRKFVIRYILDGTLLTREKFVKALPFGFYVVFLIIIYIANNFNTEKKLIEINTINKELKELRYEYISSKSKLMQLRQSSSIAARLYERGIKIPVEQPEKIKIDENYFNIK
ncbi:MAG TPA: FtsL-like putative cell division protein, partial [Bacteroidales bacterium]|nr:FtsL-like putative cell division protein [Bacteroidales bacterium]